MLIFSSAPVYQRMSALLGVIVAITGASVICGWTLQIEVLKNILPGLATMKFNTALCFVFTGVGLYTIQEGFGGRFVRRSGYVLAGLAFTIAVLTLLQYGFDWNLGIDQLIVRGDDNVDPSFRPGRMSPGTGFGLALAASALLLIDLEPAPGWRPAQLLALLGALIGGAALLGYVFGVQRFQSPIFSTMALHTAVLLLLLGGGILLARVRHGAMAVISSEGIGGRMARSALPAIVLIPVALGWLSLEGLAAGHYQTELGFALNSLAAIVILAVGVWVSAFSINRAENDIRYLNRIYAVLSGINTLIVRVRERDKLFAESIRIAVETGRLPAAWIGEIGGRVEHLEFSARSSKREGFADIMREHVSASFPPVNASGLVALAVSGKRAVIVNDIADDPRVPLQEKVLAVGIRSMVVLPLIVNDDVQAVAALYAKEEGFFNEQEMALLRELAHDIAFAMENIEKAQRLDYLANFDIVTGLPNRVLMRDRLNQALQLSRRSALHPALLLVNLDRFKLINDTLGHAAGDAVLEAVAGRLVGCARDIDTVARLGGDEFVVILADIATDMEIPGQIASCIVDEVAKPIVLAEKDVVITCSIGVALAPEDGADAGVLLQHADAAMRRVKEQDGNACERFNVEHDRLFRDRLALESALRQALDRDELSVHYQPIVDLPQGTVRAVEALVRWQHPEFGLVPPARFISIAEETGLILPIGEWVLRTACTHGRNWPDLYVAVNLSARQFRQENLVQTVAGILRETGFDPGRLELELTETMLMYDVDSAVQTMNELRKMGVRISLDDFGTGYSSLNHLKRLPVDTVKIDQSFVQDVTVDAGSMAISDAIIAMSHSLQLTVLAEGVETEEQLSLLCSRGCDQMQGFLFSRPLPAEELDQLLRTDQRLSSPDPGTGGGAKRN